MFPDDGDDLRYSVCQSDVQCIHCPDQVPLRLQQSEEGCPRCLQKRRIHSPLHLSWRRAQYLQHCDLHSSAKWERRKVFIVIKPSLNPILFGQDPRDLVSSCTKRVWILLQSTLLLSSLSCRLMNYSSTFWTFCRFFSIFFSTDS